MTHCRDKQWPLNRRASYQTHSQLTPLSIAFHTSYVHCFIQTHTWSRCSRAVTLAERGAVARSGPNASNQGRLYEFGKVYQWPRCSVTLRLTREASSSVTSSWRTGASPDTCVSPSPGRRREEETNTRRPERARALGGHALTLAGHVPACLRAAGRTWTASMRREYAIVGTQGHSGLPPGLPSSSSGASAFNALSLLSLLFPLLTRCFPDFNLVSLFLCLFHSGGTAL